MNETKKLETWCGMAALSLAARRCARRKRGRPDAIAFRAREGEEVLSLAQRLEAGRYRPEPGRVFVTERPKVREVHAAAYRDRVVHHLLHALLEGGEALGASRPCGDRPAADSAGFEAGFSSASFACRPGKGTHAAAAALQDWMWRLSRHGQQRVFALQMDVVNFFMSLHKPTLLSLLAPRIQQIQTRLAERLPASGFGPWELAERVVRHDPQRNARRVGPAGTFRRVPPHKRLGTLGPDRGLPIGNLTSQFFANVYLSPLDHFVQRTLGVRGYVRYVDDFILVDPSAERLAACRDRIVGFLQERLKLEVRAKPILPVSRGVDFLGYVIRPRYRLPRRRVIDAFRANLDHDDASLAPIEVPAGVRVRMGRMGAVRGPVRVTRLDADAIERLRARWSSFEGHLAPARAHRLLEATWRAHPLCARLLRRVSRRVRRRFALARPVVSFAAQVCQLEKGLREAREAKPTILLVQVGRFVEAPRWFGVLGLRRVRRRGRWRAGLPWGASGRLIDRALALGHPVAVALEAPEAAGNVKRRTLAYLFEPVVHVSPLCAAAASKESS
jgi:hypothetical protein